MESDNILLNNIIEEAKRLNSQLKDLEDYKADYEQEEYDEIRKNTLTQLVENAKLLENMSSGDLKASTKLDEAKKKFAETIVQNYNVKDLLGTFLAKEVFYLRTNLKQIKDMYSIGKIQLDDYQFQLAQLLKEIGKISELNEDEQMLNNYLTDKVILSKYTKDNGVNKDNLESIIKK